MFIIKATGPSMGVVCMCVCVCENQNPSQTECLTIPLLLFLCVLTYLKKKKSHRSTKISRSTTLESKWTGCKFILLCTKTYRTHRSHKIPFLNTQHKTKKSTRFMPTHFLSKRIIKAFKCPPPPPPPPHPLRTRYMKTSKEGAPMPLNLFRQIS